MQQQVFDVIKLRTTVNNVFLFVVFFFMLFIIMKSDINKLVYVLFVHLSSISLENFKDRALIIPEILELIKLHTYKFGLVYKFKMDQISSKREKCKIINFLDPICYHGNQW